MSEPYVEQTGEPRRFEDLPGAADYLERRRQMLARHERERHELANRQMEESQRMTEDFSEHTRRVTPR